MKKPKLQPTTKNEIDDPLQISINGTEYITPGGIHYLLEDPSHLKPLLEDIAIHEKEHKPFRRYYYIDDIIKLRFPEHSLRLATKQIRIRPEIANKSGFIHDFANFKSSIPDGIRWVSSFINRFFNIRRTQTVKLQGMFAMTLEKNGLLRKFQTQTPSFLVISEGSIIDGMVLSKSLDANIANTELRIAQNVYLPKQTQTYNSNLGKHHYFYYKKNEIIDIIFRSNKYKLIDYDSSECKLGNTNNIQSIDQSSSAKYKSLLFLFGVAVDLLCDIKGQKSKTGIPGKRMFPTRTAFKNLVESICDEINLAGFRTGTSENYISESDKVLQELMNEFNLKV